MPDGCEFIERAALPESDRKKICFRTAEQVFGLGAHGDTAARSAGSF
jgi:hypothetical protein